MAASPNSMAWRDPASLHKYGQEQYRAGNLSLALEAFDKALRLNLPDTVGILDNRAATLLKLGRLEPALRDGRRMVKTDGKDGRGYLRCGKVLQLMGKPDKALEIYSYGLKVLPSDLPSRNLIMQLKDKLHVKMEGPRLVDPFTILPAEIICMILEYFSFKELVGILRVSRQWQTYLGSLPNLWTHLDLSGARSRRPGPSPRRVTMSAIRRYTSRSKSRLTHVTLNYVVESNLNKVLEIVTRYPHLSYLDLRDNVHAVYLPGVLRPPVNLTTLKISRATELSPVVFLMLLNNLPQLEYVEAFLSTILLGPWPEKMPNLRTIILGKTRDMSRIPLGDYIPGLVDDRIEERLPKLEELCFSGLLPAEFFTQGISFSSLPNFRRLRLDGVETLDFPKLPPSLEELHISGTERPLRDYILLPNGLPEFTELPNLKSLTLTKSRCMTLEFLKSMLEGTEAKPTTLDLSGSLKLDGRDVGELILTKNLENVEELNISYLANVTDHLSSIIIKHLPNLKVLNVNQTQITGVFVKDLVDAADLGIERLLVEGCGNLAADAIKYARAKGVDVVSVVRG